MKIDLLPLINNSESVIEIDQKIDIPKEYYENTDIRQMGLIDVTGRIDDIGNEMFNIILNVKGKMILPCAVSLEDVEYPFEINIEENIGNDEEIEENYKIVSNTLDILPILWENIVLEIPNKVVKENAEVKKEGDGWCLTSEGEPKNKSKLSELKELLDMEGE